MSTEVYLLLRSVTGRKKKTESAKKGDFVSVKKGELVEPIPADQEVHTPRDKPPPNYRLCSDHELTFHASAHDVAPLNGSEAFYLQAVELFSARTQLYVSGALQSVAKLKENDKVSVHVERGIVNGKIQRIGADGDKPGIYFLVEILDEKPKWKLTSDKKPHSNRGSGKTISVPADKIVLVASDKSTKDSGGNTTKKAPDGGMMTRSGAAGRGHSSVDRLSPGATRKAKGTSKGVLSAEPDALPLEKGRFNVGDRVMMHSSQGFPVHGTVRWIGTVAVSKESNMEKPVIFAGIETDIPVTPEKDFPDIHVDVTGSHGQKLFGVEKSHGRIYLPEQVVERLNSPRCLVTGENEEGRVAGCLEENSMTKGMPPGELFEQQAAYRNYEAQQAMKESNKKRDYFQQAVPGESQQRVEAWKQQFEQGNERKGRMGGESSNSLPGSFHQQHVQPLQQYEGEMAAEEAGILQASAQNAVSRNLYSDQSGLPSGGSAFPRNSGGMPSHSDARERENYEKPWENYERPLENYEKPLSEIHPQPAPAHPAHLSSASTHGISSQQTSRTDSGGLGANPWEARHLGLRDFTLSSSDAEALLGTSVCLRNNPDRKGVIRWIGSLPDYPRGVIAGIELNEPHEGCTDGMHQGSRHFYCSPGRALFVPLESVQEVVVQTGREARPGPRNPLYLVPERVDYDPIGSPDLFDMYIGDGKGIQGHYNSCYLDSTVFALFALNDSFDSLLFEKSPSQDGQRIQDIILKRIVNPLRTSGAARHESVMQLRNALESLGAMKGVNTDEKDPEEFLNMLFKNILNVKPFISIKRPFGVEKEFFIQLFFEMDNQSTEVPNSEKLLQKMFREQKISFAKVPSKLLLQMPRFGKEYKIFNRIIPAVSVDVNPMLDISAIGEQPCFICELKAAIGCQECKEKYPAELQYVFLCTVCSERAHLSAKAQQHKCEDLPNMGSCNSITKLDLLSVVCIETSHYVCFTRTPTGRWLFHDSMANRVYDVYNIPRVIDVTDLLKEWVYDPSHGQRLKDTPEKQIPEIVRRFTQDIYMCVYVHPELGLYLEDEV